MRGDQGIRIAASIAGWRHSANRTNVAAATSNTDLLHEGLYRFAAGRPATAAIDGWRHLPAERRRLIWSCDGALFAQD